MTSPFAEANGWVPDLRPIRHVHIVGIGGAAMSGLGHILLTDGHRVTGSDLSEGPELAQLRAAGATVWSGHDAAHIAGAGLVAISTAVRQSNPEVVAAIANAVPLAGRPAMMEAISSRKRTVAISGTHGKTTTSAMATVALDAAGFAPSFLVGARLPQLGRGVRWVPGPWFVAEADESDSSFLRFRAEAAIVTNLEEDHLDFHETMENLEAAFDTFLDQAATARVVCADDAGARRLAARHAGSVTYGTADDADYRIANYERLGLGARFDVEAPGGERFEVRLQTGGIHNARNATAVLAMGAALGAEERLVLDGLAGFRGVERRFEFRGVANGVTFVDDYAHLPAKVAATLQAARAAAEDAGWKRIVVVFQPHRFTRVRSLGKDFADSFVCADLVVVTPIYAAGQDPIPGVTSRVVSDAIRARHPESNVVDADDREGLIGYLMAELLPGDLCLTLNAGDLTALPDELLARLR